MRMAAFLPFFLPFLMCSNTSRYVSSTNGVSQEFGSCSFLTDFNHQGDISGEPLITPVDFNAVFSSELLDSKSHVAAGQVSALPFRSINRVACISIFI